MDNEHEGPDSGFRGSSPGPAERGFRGSSPGPAERVRLPGYDEPPRGRGPAWDWQDYDYGPPRGYPGYPRENGLRSLRRASTWTAAALIAGVAVTTGYLAHSIPVNGAGSSSTSGGRASPAAKPGAASPGPASPSAPAVQPPVVTSGGSGAAGGAGGGGGDN
ncbi:MAG: hypothetical protein ACR2FU_00685 [Streptosporangiaceae bacterium]